MRGGGDIRGYTELDSTGGVCTWFEGGRGKVGIMDAQRQAWRLSGWKSFTVPIHMYSVFVTQMLRIDVNMKSVTIDSVMFPMKSSSFWCTMQSTKLGGVLTCLMISR